MLDRCVAAAHAHGVTVSTLLSPDDRFEFGEDTFDIVYGANVLHHVGNIEPLLEAVKKALVPGGRFFFFDPLAYNPAIQIYRSLAYKVRTADERPLRFSHLKAFRQLFREVHHREFWFATLLLFLKYFFVDRINPNTDRYWKRILREDPRRIGWWFGPLVRFDTILLRIPPLNRLAWNIVIWGKK